MLVIIYGPEGNSLLINESTAERLGLRQYQRIYDKRRFHEIAMQNCLDGIAICQLNIAMKEFSEPDKDADTAS